VRDGRGWRGGRRKVYGAEHNLCAGKGIHFYERQKR
jgi:hypothetical protein